MRTTPVRSLKGDRSMSVRTCESAAQSRTQQARLMAEVRLILIHTRALSAHVSLVTFFERELHRSTQLVTRTWTAHKTKPSQARPRLGLVAPESCTAQFMASISATSPLCPGACKQNSAVLVGKRSPTYSTSPRTLYLPRRCEILTLANQHFHCYYDGPLHSVHHHSDPSQQDIFASVPDFCLVTL